MKNFIQISKKEYRNFFEKSLFKTFFHNPEWHDFLEKGFKWLKFEYYFYKDEAILPFGGFKVFGREKLVSLPFCEYGGPLLMRDGLSFEEFKNDAVSEFGERIKIRFHPEMLKYFKIPSPEFQTAGIYTNLIENLKATDLNQLLDSFRKTLRHEIRNAENKNLKIKRCENEKELKQFYNLYLVNLKRKRTVPYPFSIFEFLYNNLNAEILLAIFKDKIIGGSLFLNYDRFVHYFLSATDYGHREYGVAHLLLWEKIKNLVGGDKIFDLGATPKNSSLYTFKRGWGGKEYPILQIGIKKSSENLRSSKLKIIWSLLPDFLIKKLAPKLIKYRL